MKQAQKELDDFLFENKHLIPYQARLNKAMNSVPDHLRLLVLSFYIADNIDELSTELQILATMLKKV
jgi:hypothetical protein